MLRTSSSNACGGSVRDHRNAAVSGKIYRLSAAGIAGFHRFSVKHDQYQNGFSPEKALTYHTGKILAAAGSADSGEPDCPGKKSGV